MRFGIAVVGGAQYNFVLANPLAVDGGRNPIEVNLMSNVQETIRKQVDDNPVLLYMKGTPQFPECGFSMRTVQALDSCGVQYASVNVLEDEGIRQGIKEFGNWPTIPQLYIKGELLGGCDIVMEMYQSGELKQQLQQAAE